MIEHISESRGLRGSVEAPADKSIAHRAAMIAALADGTSEIIGYPASADPQSTLQCLRSLGVEIESDGGSTFVHGKGLTGLMASSAPLDCGNSGTTMRLLAGILAGQQFDSVLTGDSSLSQRPMRRIAAPLERMGAEFRLADDHAPISMRGTHPLRAIKYDVPVASAQVKSCVLLAGLYADGQTVVAEKLPTRDHTERMLGLEMWQEEGTHLVRVTGGTPVEARTWQIPGDFSAAAFFLVAGTLTPDSRLEIVNVGMNPTRTGLLDVLLEMGAQIEVHNRRHSGGEIIADLRVESSSLRATSVGGGLIPAMIDEVPVLALAATQAEGRTEIRDAGELRFKESDRIATVAANLRSLGANVKEHEDGLVIEGPTRLRGTTVDSYHDHRIAMSMGVAGLLAEGRTAVSGAECAAVSFPGYWEELRRLSG